ncbi:copper-binding protein [Streptomyces sp. NPDC020801]|uniref:copper-binding protein n=1 Tax=unclassified Streptomyces TaxID=2593676 RepID=UPI0037B32BB9
MAGRFSGGRAAAGVCAVGLAALLAACGNSGSGGGSAGTSASTPSQGGQATSTTVTVDMTEYKLALSSKTFQAGDYTFVAKNDGHTLHSLEIEGPGGDARLPHGLQPGQSASLKVTLKNGSYELYCPVDGHKDLGMKTNITVGGSGGGSAPTGTSSSGGGY